MRLTTRDVGLAIRDHVEGKTLHHFDESGTETDDSMTITDCFETVDCSDASNLVLCTAEGERFIVRIFAA